MNRGSIAPQRKSLGSAVLVALPITGAVGFS